MPLVSALIELIRHPKRLPVITIHAAGRLRLRCGHSPESHRSRCRCFRTGGCQPRQGKFSEVFQWRSSSCSARKVATNLLVDHRKRSLRAYNSNLTRPPRCGWLRVVCNCFRQLLVCKLLTEKPKEGCNSPPPGNLSQPLNPLLGSYSSPTAVGFPS